ncbi:uncharacterized protein LOC124119955 [Haliotis rufescens]|uniref:uncharacterized protein LOC124119955 n=1 Tax=Haliotis rufescens TaxID=6454 RepID=UPI00201EA429|nr:uncharacterized protein LOC124119955 [Haliotis rufescens]
MYFGVLTVLGLLCFKGHTMKLTWLMLAVCVARGTFYLSASSSPESHRVQKRQATVVVTHGVVNIDRPGNSADDDSVDEAEDPSHFNDTKSEEEENEDEEFSNGSRSRRLIFKDKSDLWPKGILPYIFEDDLGSDARNEISITQRRIEKYTCIRFVPWVKGVTKATYNLSHEGHLNFVDDSGCWSYIGFGSSASGRNIKCCSRHYCTHELGHALGFLHEHTSPKRAGYVRPNFQNVDPSNWGIYDIKSQSDYEDLRFDMTSHMHYNPTGYSKNGWYTQTVLFRDLQPMLQNRGNVYYSWHALAHAYTCTEEKCPSGAAVTCVNDGFVSYIDNSTCACICPPGLDPAKGCSDVIKQVPAPTKWPAGTYAMPSATEGCPGDVFLDGYVQHTSDGGSTQSATVHVKGAFTPSSSKYHFCVKNSSTSDDADTAEWGPGRYCIHKKGDCPTGFESGYVKYDNLAGTTTTTSGSLPDGVYDADTRLDFCCRDDGYPIVPLKLPNTKPFILFRHKGEADSCQEVDGMLANPEFLQFDDDSEGQAAFSPRLLAKRFIYCYYVPAERACGGLYTLTKENPTQTITSPGYPSLYPNNLDCFWIFKAPEDSTILLNFDDFEIATSSTSECEDELCVRSVLLGENPFTYCGESLHRTIRTVRNTLSLNLRTTPEGQRKGFQAQISLVTPENHCYRMDDKGVTYNGNVSFTRGRKTCLPWSETTTCPHHLFNPSDFDANLKENYCRNPDNTFRPWCYTGVYEGQCDRDYCDVCQLESKFDNYPDCAELKEAGFCEKDQTKARAGCARTCDTPNVPVTPVTTCSAPNVAADADPVTTLNCSYNPGDTVQFKCKSGTDTLTRTCLTDGTWSPGGYVCGSCPNGWKFYNGDCFVYVNVEKNYADAVSHCQTLGAIVAPTKDMKELEFVSGLREKKKLIWIGGTDIDTEGSFKWSDGAPFTWTNWEGGKPNNFANNQDCVEAYTEKHQHLWNDMYCFSERTFVCSRKRDSRSICVDRRQDCNTILKSSPKACVEYDKFAGEQCPLTCGVCNESGSSLTCLVAAASTNVILEGATDKVPRGHVVQYRCKDGHVRQSGHPERACLASGQLSGEDLVCEAVATSVTPSNNVDLVARLEYGNKYYAYLGDNALMRINREGDLTQWEYYATTAGKAMLQVWRPRSDVGERKFEFIGQNLLDTKKTGRMEVLNVPINDRIPVEPGDVIGIHYFDPLIGITFTKCNNELTPEAANMSWINQIISDMDYFTPGQHYTRANKNKCFIMSFRAWVGPVVTCDVPPAHPNAILKTTTNPVRIATVVKYACKGGYDRLSGDAQRKCLGSGQMEGEELICEDTSMSVTPSNNVDLIARPTDGSKYWSYMGDNDLMRINRDGEVVQWQFFSTRQGRALLQVWRPRSDAGSRKFEFIGHNLVDSKVTGQVDTFDVPEYERIQVKKGDLIGIYYYDPPLGIAFTMCSASKHPEASQISWINTKVENPSYFVSGEIYDQAVRKMCFIMSFRAIVGPERKYKLYPTNWLPLISRGSVGPGRYVYSGINDNFRIQHGGQIIQWKFFSKYVGDLALQVWREVKTNQFSLVGQNIVKTIDNAVQVVNVSASDRISVEAGHLIGFHYGKNKGGLCYTYCNGHNNPEATNVSWMEPSISNSADITPDMVFTFQRKTCRIFSLTAFIKPVD